MGADSGGDDVDYIPASVEDEFVRWYRLPGAIRPFHLRITYLYEIAARVVFVVDAPDGLPGQGVKLGIGVVRTGLRGNPVPRRLVGIFHYDVACLAKTGTRPFHPAQRIAEGQALRRGGCGDIAAVPIGKRFALVMEFQRGAVGPDLGNQQAVFVVAVAGAQQLYQTVRTEHLFEAAHDVALAV